MRRLLGKALQIAPRPIAQIGRMTQDHLADPQPSARNEQDDPGAVSRSREDRRAPLRDGENEFAAGGGMQHRQYIQDKIMRFITMDKAQKLEVKAR